MAITILFETESPRGSVTLTSDLTDLDAYTRGKEIQQFFEAVTSLKCSIFDLEKKDAELKAAYESSVQTQTYPEGVTCDPIMVIS